jgi:hypothetical protein
MMAPNSDTPSPARLKLPWLMVADQNTLLGVGAHDDAGDPADDAAHHNPDNQVHGRAPVIVATY